MQREVARAGRALDNGGLGDLVWGHVSVRDPGGRGTWMKAAGWALQEVDETRVLLVGPDGAVLAGEGLRHSEWPIHARVMIARPEVQCVVHAHPTHVLAFAALGVALRPLSHDGCLFAPDGPGTFSGSSELIDTINRGDDVAADLGDSLALILPGHGVVTAGPSPAHAVMAAVLLERACRLQLLAMAAGVVQVYPDRSEALRKKVHCWPDIQLRHGYDALVRRDARRQLEPFLHALATSPPAAEP